MKQAPPKPSEAEREAAIAVLVAAQVDPSLRAGLVLDWFGLPVHHRIARVLHASAATDVAGLIASGLRDADLAELTGPTPTPFDLARATELLRDRAARRVLRPWIGDDADGVDPVGHIAGRLRAAADRAETLLERPAIADAEGHRWLPLADVDRTPVPTRWSGRLPTTGLGLVEGASRGGKTTVVAAVAAAWTTGAPLPGDTATHRPGRVLWVATDEGTRRAARRLAAAGCADGMVSLLDLEGAPLMLRDTVAIDKALEQHNATLLVLDSLKDAVTGDDADELALRPLLDGVRRIAERRGALVIGIRHSRKGGARAIDRGAGSIAYSAKADAVLTVAERDGRRYLAVAKYRDDCEGRTLEFCIAAGPTIAWGSSSDLSADDLAAEEPTRRDRKGDGAGDAVLAVLAAGPLAPGQAVEAAIRRAGCSRRTVERAAQELLSAGRIEARGRGGYGPPRVWALADVAHHGGVADVADAGGCGDSDPPTHVRHLAAVADAVDAEIAPHPPLSLSSANISQPPRAREDEPPTAVERRRQARHGDQPAADEPTRPPPPPLTGTVEVLS